MDDSALNRVKETVSKIEDRIKVERMKLDLEAELSKAPELVVHIGSAAAAIKEALVSNWRRAIDARRSESATEKTDGRTESLGPASRHPLQG